MPRKILTHKIRQQIVSFRYEMKLQKKRYWIKERKDEAGSDWKEKEKESAMKKGNLEVWIFKVIKKQQGKETTQNKRKLNQPTKNLFLYYFFLFYEDFEFHWLRV